MQSDSARCSVLACPTIRIACAGLVAAVQDQLAELRHEIQQYNEAILQKPAIVVLNKSDIVDFSAAPLEFRVAKALHGHSGGAEEGAAASVAAAQEDVLPVVLVSAKTGDGLAALQEELHWLLSDKPTTAP
jgi:GTPase involved in cell partitioning and DNA repair